MWDAAARWIVLVASAYAAAGLVFGLVFVAVGAQRIDPAARGASLLFRALILPGSAALWPLLLKRWLGGQRAPPVERTAHRAAAGTEEVA